MGFLINESKSTAWYHSEKMDGKFVHEDSVFCNWATSGGRAD